MKQDSWYEFSFMQGFFTLNMPIFYEFLIHIFFLTFQTLCMAIFAKRGSLTKKQVFQQLHTEIQTRNEVKIWIRRHN